MIGVIGLPLAAAVFLLREPTRGKNEQLAVLGEFEGDDEGELPVSLALAFERLSKFQILKSMLVGLGTLEFALFSIPLFNLFLEHQYGSMIDRNSSLRRSLALGDPLGSSERPPLSPSLASIAWRR